jgi:hypothetical protein
MESTKMYESSYATMWYHPEKKIVHHQVHKFIFGEEFQKLLLTGTDTLKKNQACKWLSDDRSNTALKKEDMEWATTSWFPQTVQSGWKFWAIVQPEKIIAQINMEKAAADYAQAGVVARFFTDPDEAMKWLESQ